MNPPSAPSGGGTGVGYPEASGGRPGAGPPHAPLGFYGSWLAGSVPARDRNGPGKGVEARLSPSRRSGRGTGPGLERFVRVRAELRPPSPVGGTGGLGGPRAAPRGPGCGPSACPETAVDAGALAAGATR